MSKVARDMMMGMYGAGFTFAGAGDLRLDINPAEGVVLSGSLIESIADQSGNGNDFVKVNDGTRPDFVGSDASYNGKPVISFPSDDDRVLKSSAIYDLLSNTNGMHVFIVGESTNASDHYFCRYGDVDAVRFRTEYQLFYDNVGGSSTLSVDTTGGPKVMGLYWNPGTKTGLWVNGVEAETDTSSIPAALGTGGSDPWVIGATSTYGSNLRPGKIARLLVYAEYLSEATAAEIRDALNAEYATH